MNNKDLLLQWVEKNHSEFHAVSDAIWEHPELGLHESFASDQLTALLNKYGFTVDRNISGMPTAFIASWGEGRPILGFSSEYDALPGLSQRNDTTFYSPVTPNAPGHGCGHNLLSVGGIMAACAVKERMEKEKLSGSIKIFGTPSEETCIGKPFMAKDGHFGDVDIFFDWHPSHLNRGTACSSNAYFNIKYHFRGKTAHGNAPWHGRSALDAAMLTGHGIELLREHIKPGLEDAATTLNYAFPDVGNSFPNVVPDYSVLWCIGRIKNAEMAKDVICRLNACAQGCASATGTSVETEVITATHDLIPNLCLAQAVDQNLRYTGLPRFTADEEKIAKAIQAEMDVAQTGFTGIIEPVTLGRQPVTDSSEYSWFAPIAFLNLALMPSESAGWHNWAVSMFAGSQIGKKVLNTAASVLACTAYDVLTSSDLLEDAKNELIERLDGQVYQTLLPEEAAPASS